MNRIAWFNVLAFAGTLVTYVFEKISAFVGG